MGIELVLESKNHEPYLAMRITCDDCNRLLDIGRACICWDYANNGNIKKWKVLCMGKECAGSSENKIQLPASSPIEHLKLSKKIALF